MTPDVRQFLSDLLHGGETAGSPGGYVGQDEVRMEPADEFQGFRTIFTLTDNLGLGLLLKQSPEAVTHHLVGDK
ncbi:MAG: hypothetical protein JSW27_22605 [Phycisphaerales bacterium]|nr:MAG: hypothetical protein JSW27_22605 [Phycisphaerales bacterium]